MLKRDSLGDYPLRLFDAREDFCDTLVIRDDIQKKPARTGINCPLPNCLKGFRAISKQKACGSG